MAGTSLGPLRPVNRRDLAEPRGWACWGGLTRLALLCQQEGPSPVTRAPTSGSLCQQLARQGPSPRAEAPPNPHQGLSLGLQPPSPQPTPGTVPGAEAPPAHAGGRHTTWGDVSMQSQEWLLGRSACWRQLRGKPGCQKLPPPCFADQVVLSEHVASPRSETSPRLGGWFLPRSADKTNKRRAHAPLPRPAACPWPEHHAVSSPVSRESLRLQGLNH